MLLWTELCSISSQMPLQIVSVAFVFILVGYGTKAGFVPLHNWLPDVYSEGITPVLSLMSGVLLNLAFYAILRFKFVADNVTGYDFTNNLLLGFGLVTIIVAALFLLRQREIKRLFAYSSIEHIGLICFAFGLNTPLALFAGLLHMTLHAVTKSAAFFNVGQIIQVRNTLLMDNIRGLIHDKPGLAWGLLLSGFFLIGMPPSALFTSELLIIYSTTKENIWLLIPLVTGLIISFAAISYQIQKMVFHKNENVVSENVIQLSLLPIYLHLLVVVSLGIFIPVALGHWFEQIIQFMRNMQ
jgi:hydrogenase-4 component F